MTVSAVLFIVGVCFFTRVSLAVFVAGCLVLSVSAGGGGLFLAWTQFLPPQISGQNRIFVILYSIRTDFRRTEGINVVLQTEKDNISLPNFLILFWARSRFRFQNQTSRLVLLARENRHPPGPM